MSSSYTNLQTLEELRSFKTINFLKTNIKSNWNVGCVISKNILISTGTQFIFCFLSTSENFPTIIPNLKQQQLLFDKSFIQLSYTVQPKFQPA